MNSINLPFESSVLARMQEAAVHEARAALTARRFLAVEGPFGVGYTVAPSGIDEQRQHVPHGATTVISRAIPVPQVYRHFSMPRRRIAAHAETGQPLDLSAVKAAARTVALREEELIYRGDPEFGLAGLCTAEGRHHLDGGDWSDVERALKDVLDAANLLDGAHYHGPYALALEPRLYNGLFRRYPEGSDLLQIEHLRNFCAAGIYKAEVDGAVLAAAGAGTLLVGEDLAVDYTFPDSVHFNFVARESLTLRIDAPAAICTIRPRAPG